MALMLDELAAFLDAASTRFTAGTNLFADFLPDEPNRATLLVEMPGGPPARVMSTGSPAWENARFAVFSRSTSSTQAHDDLDVAWNTFEGVVNQSLSGTYYLRVAANESPYLWGRDEIGRAHFTASFSVMRSR